MTVLNREIIEEQARGEVFDQEWGGLDGQALLDYIGTNEGIDIPLCTVNEGCFVWESLQRKLNEHFREINVTVGSREVPEGQPSMVARIVLRSTVDGL